MMITYRKGAGKAQDNEIPTSTILWQVDFLRRKSPIQSYSRKLGTGFDGGQCRRDIQKDCRGSDTRKDSHGEQTIQKVREMVGGQFRFFKILDDERDCVVKSLGLKPEEALTYEYRVTLFVRRKTLDQRLSAMYIWHST
jgi:hypothetical protein